MSKNRKIVKRRAIKTAAVMGALVLAASPVIPSVGSFSNSLIVSAEEAAKSTVKTTIWNNAEIGEHEGNGSMTYDSATKSLVVTGAGTKFDKDSGNDNYYYSYVDIKGKTTVVAKITPDANNASGMVGLIARNDAEDATSQAAGIYYDYSKKQIRIGRHGGASTILSNVDTAVYVKLEFDTDAVYYTVANDAEFTDVIKARNGMGVTGLDPKTVGFFATEGNTVTFSDVEIISNYNQDDIDYTKVVFDSEVGELKTSNYTSADYNDAGDMSYTETADGNVLSVVANRGALKKGNIRQDERVNYMLFPSTSEDMTIKADIVIKSINSGTDKQGVALGQFSVNEEGKRACSTIHFHKNLKIQHTYSTTPGSGGCGSLANAYELGKSYSLTYTKKENAAYLSVVDASGSVIGTNEIDLTSETFYSGLQSGQEVQYGFAFTGVEVDISNVTLLNSNGQIVYDMNDYYIAEGVAPTIANPTATVASDRNSIELAWDITGEGSGNVKYIVYVSKDGADYTKVSESKVNEFSYTAMSGDGSYAFKIVPVGGDTQGTAVESAAVSYQAPLAQAVLSGTGSATSISLTWDAVEGADSYEIYRSLGSTGETKMLKQLADTSYVDTDIVTEEPYFYYVIAKNENNTSNPSAKLQVLATDGHTGAYVYENEAAELTVVSKSNDTVMDKKASVVMKSDKSGTVELKVNGTKVSRSIVSAGSEFTLNMNLVQGRNDVEVLFTDSNGAVTRKLMNFVSNPKINAIVDKAYTGVNGATVDGYPTFASVEAAVNSVASDNAESYVIFIKNGEYNERVTVESPNVSLLGEDAEKTHIYYSAALSEKTATSMWDRNAMYVDSTADGFTCENLTIENSFNYTNGSDQQADALCIVADETLCVNVRLIGYQDTLLTDSRVKDSSGNYEVTRQYFEKCYITGNVDFIYGAGTSFFKDCDIVARYTNYKSDGCFTAGRTYATTKYGYVFDSCNFIAEDGVNDGAYRLARPWGKDDSTTFINCYMGRAVATAEGQTYGDMSGNKASDARFAEYGSYGPGFVVNNTRPYLSSAEAEDFTAEKVMNGFSYDEVMSALYKADDASETPSETPTETPSETPTETPTETPSETPSDNTTETGNSGEESSSVNTDTTGEVAADEDKVEASTSGEKAEVAADETKAGDSSRIGLFAVLAAVSGIFAGVAGFAKKKEEDQ